jgi:cytochrome P450
MLAWMTTPEERKSGGRPAPGSSGLPLLGETLAFLKDSFGFVESRVGKYGPVFRSSILGRPAVFIVGARACEVWVDAALLERDGAMPPHVKELFGGESLPSLDGAAHATRKQLVLSAFRKDALRSYLPTIDATVRASLTACAAAGELPMVQPLKELAIESICATMASMKKGPELDALLGDYGAIGPGLGSLPIPMPGTAFSRARKAMSRIFALYDRLIAAHQTAPSADGLSRMLAAKTTDGAQLTPDDAKRELHHVVIAGLIVWADFASSFTLLADHPTARDALVAEVTKLDAGPLDLDALLALPVLRRTVMEIKRLCPIVPAQFARARVSFEVEGYTVPEGAMVLWGVRSTNIFAGTYGEPTKFDPDRFVPSVEGGRGEHEKHEHAFVPQGPGPEGGHRCPGVDLATLFMSVFIVRLLQGYTWEIPAQDLGMRWNLIPPEPVDGLRVKLQAR